MSLQFIRFIKDTKADIFSVPQNIMHLSHLSPGNILADMFQGFDTINNCLSLFEYKNIDEKNRLIVNYDSIRHRFKTISDKIEFVEFDDTYLNNIGLGYKKTLITDSYDPLANTNHYDIYDLNSHNLTYFIHTLNNDIHNKKLPLCQIKRKNFLSLAITSIENNYIDLSNIDEKVKNEYLKKIYKPKA